MLSPLVPAQAMLEEHWTPSPPQLFPMTLLIQTPNHGQSSQTDLGHVCSLQTCLVVPGLHPTLPLSPDPIPT